MEFSVINHRLHFKDKPVKFKKSPNIGGFMTPKILVLHDTAGRLNGDSSVSWLTNKTANASAHLVVSRDGRVTQLVPFNVIAWHAGVSKYEDRKSVNSFGIGIEIVNPGRLSKGADDTARAWFNQLFDIKQHRLEYAETKEHGKGWWMPYPEKQIAVLRDLTDTLMANYNLSDITTHYAISPGRKFDVNPLFPIENFRARAGLTRSMGGA